MCLLLLLCPVGKISHVSTKKTPFYFELPETIGVLIVHNHISAVNDSVISHDFLWVCDQRPHLRHSSENGRCSFLSSHSFHLCYYQDNFMCLTEMAKDLWESHTSPGLL